MTHAPKDDVSRTQHNEETEESALAVADPSNLRGVRILHRKKQPDGSEEHDSSSVSIVEERASSALPRPSLLREYDNLVPGLAEKLANDMLASTRHLRDIEQAEAQSRIRGADAESKRKSRGLNFGFVIALAGITASAVLGWVGAPVAAAIVGGGALATVATALIVKRGR